MSFEVWDKIPRLYQGKTVVCIASGPSLTQEDCEQCRHLVTVCVNDAWRLAPWADVLYACDAAWWTHYKGVPEFRGMKVTHDMRCAQTWGCKRIRVKADHGFSASEQWIHGGNNSGFQGLDLALHMGAAKVLLLGYDMKANGRLLHFFGDHPKELSNSPPPPHWIKIFNRAAQMHKGAPIINCTRDSALECFPRMTIEEALSDETACV